MMRLLRCSAALALSAGMVSAADPYETYVKTSKDFQRVKQEKAWALKAWPSWTYMPWTYKWPVGYDDGVAKWCRQMGYNGAYLDRGSTRVAGVNKLEWIDKHKLRFYMDHSVDKRRLKVKYRGGVRGGKTLNRDDRKRTDVRPVPLNDATLATLKGILERYVSNVKGSPNRAAYALDDEASWGSYVRPFMWQITDERGKFDAWLKEVYGADNAPKHAGWETYDHFLPKLKSWAVKDFNCAQLADQWTFNDSHWCNVLGELVACANRIDPATPCGIVGAQSPNTFGGYDYAKLMRKVQFIEAYNVGDSQSVVRSFNPRNALPTVTTHFHKRVRDTVWQTWYYLAHGNRGFIGWVDGWFDMAAKKPLAWHEQVAPHYREAGGKIGPLVSGAEWIDDGVGLYYSQASLQVAWILDAECHGRTWPSRTGDARLGSSHLARHAWENMLRDEGLQYTYIDYATVIQQGVPKHCKVLILPTTLALSDAEASRIRDFCKAGGTVIADFMPGLWDQHARGRADGGALDEMFAVKHDPSAKAADVFGRKFWCETDQDKAYNYKTYDELMKTSTAEMDASGFNKAVRKMPVAKVNKYGQGTAVLMNLSTQWYNAYRVKGAKPAARREAFLKHVRAGGARPWVRISGADAEKVHGYEITYWAKDGRTILFVVSCPELRVSGVGGGNAVGLKADPVEITLKLAGKVKSARDERAGKDLGDGDAFRFTWKMNEAVVMSFAAGPPK